MWANLFMKCTNQRLVLVRTLRRSRRRQIARRIGKFLFIGAECEAYKVAEAFLRQTMIACKGSKPRRHRGIPRVIPQICPPGPCRATNQSPRLLSAKLQHNVRCKIICGILLTSKYWHTEDVERCVSGLMQSHEEKLSNGCIGRRYSGRGSLVWDGIQNVLQKLVADRHGRLEVLSLIIGIYRAAFCRLDGQLLGRSGLSIS